MYLGNKEIYLIFKMRCIICFIFHKCHARGGVMIICCLIMDIAYSRGQLWVGMEQSRVILAWGNWRNSEENGSHTVLLCISHCNAGLNLWLYRKKWGCNHLCCGRVIAFVLFMKPVTLFIVRQYTNMPKLYLLGLEVFQPWGVSPHFWNKNYMQFKILRLHVTYKSWKFCKEITR